MSLFLTQEEIDELSGIKRGRNGLSRDARQCQFLREHGIPFIANFKGAPKVCVSAIQGGKQSKSNDSWQPRVLQKVA